MSQRLSSISGNDVPKNPSAVASSRTPTIQEILLCADSVQAASWCNDEGLNGDEKFETVLEAKIALLQHRGNLLNLTTLLPPVSF